MSGTNKIVTAIFEAFLSSLESGDIDQKLIQNIRKLIAQEEKITSAKLEKVIFEDNDEL